MPSTDALRPPGPAPVTYHPLSLLGYAQRMRTDVVGRIAERFEAYGDLYFAPFLGSDVYVLRHPEHIQEVLVTQAHRFEKPSTGLVARQLRRLLGDGLLNSNGELWRRQRRLIQPAFRKESLVQYAELVVLHTREWLDGCRDERRLDVSREMMQLTLRIVSKALFDLKLEGEVDRFAHAMTAFRGAFSRLGAALPSWLPSPGQRRALQALADVDALLYGLIDAPRSKDGHDLLTALMNAEDAKGQRGMMGRKQLRDELITLFVAGHETSSHALTWTWHLLSLHPEVEAKFHAEVDGVLGGRAPNLADLTRLPYTEQILCEAMRLYPPAYVLPRVAVEDAEIGGYRIPRGSELVIRIYHTHHDKRWFPDPERFDPERFAPARRKTLPACAYIPFGAGSRLCIGKHFAMMEALLILVCTAQRLRLRAVPGRAPKLDMALTLAPKGGLPMQVQTRAPAVAHA